MLSVTSKLIPPLSPFEVTFVTYSGILNEKSWLFSNKKFTGSRKVAVSFFRSVSDGKLTVGGEGLTDVSPQPAN